MESLVEGKCVMGKCCWATVLFCFFKSSFKLAQQSTRKFYARHASLCWRALNTWPKQVAIKASWADRLQAMRQQFMEKKNQPSFGLTCIYCTENSSKLLGLTFILTLGNEFQVRIVWWPIKHIDIMVIKPVIGYVRKKWNVHFQIAFNKV